MQVGTEPIESWLCNLPATCHHQARTRIFEKIQKEPLKAKNGEAKPDAYAAHRINKYLRKMIFEMHTVTKEGCRGMLSCTIITSSRGTMSTCVMV